MKQIIKKCIKPIKTYYSDLQIHREQVQEEDIIMSPIDISTLTPLTSSEKMEVDKLFKDIVGGKMSYLELSMFKTINGFDPRYVSHYFYLPAISRRLNNYHYTRFLEHKSLLDRLSHSTFNYPTCLVRVIEGEYYNESMNQISMGKAVDICHNEVVFFIKDSVESSGGKGIEKIDLRDIAKGKKRDVILDAISKRGRNYVIQRPIIQSQQMNSFNPYSVNTIRITSLYLNGECSILSCVLRMGRTKAIVDNLGSGGIMVGINNDGTLMQTGYDEHLNHYNSNNGIVFKDVKIDSFSKILEAIKKEHMNNYSLCKLIGWDICITAANEPLIIEINSSQPGLTGSELCCGPIFGDRTIEVLDYCKGKEFRYDRSIISY